MSVSPFDRVKADLSQKACFVILKIVCLIAMTEILSRIIDCLDVPRGMIATVFSCLFPSPYIL